MEAVIRTERRFGVTAKSSVNATARLYALYGTETWQDLLDVMEQVCIEIETDLINTAASDEAAVLANYRMSKAAWMVFTHMQQKVIECFNAYLSKVTPQPIGPIFTDEERERENILNPLTPMLVSDEADTYGPI